MLLRGDGGFRHRFAFVHLGQALIVIIYNSVVIATFFIDFQEAFENHNLPSSAQLDLTIGTAKINGCAFHSGGRHLTGDGPFVDQVIQLALIRLGHFDVVRAAHHICGADTFVRFLRVLGFVFVHPRRRRDKIFAELGLDRRAGFVNRFGCHVDAVGPHVGDETRFIETLSGVHGLPCAHAKLAAGFLLQGRCHERGRGVAACRFGLS